MKAKQEEEEEYQPGDADASRRCRRVFLSLETDCEESDGAEADDEGIFMNDKEVSARTQTSQKPMMKHLIRMIRM